MNTGYGYDAFTLEDNYYTDSFYNDMVSSIQIKNTLSSKEKLQGVVEGFDGINEESVCSCAKLARHASICNKVIYDKTKEIMELKGSMYIFYILLIIAVFIIINQRMTINTLNSFMYIMKLQKNNPVSGSNDMISNIFN